MTAIRTITISLPAAMGREVLQVARAEHRTVSELLREAFRQYRGRRNLQRLARAGRAAVKAKGVRAADLGGPFEE